MFLEGEPVESDQRDPVASAMVWVSRITTIALEMLLPGLAGFWLDNRWGTGFLAILGFAFGMVGGMWHLLLLTGAVGSKKSSRARQSGELRPNDPRNKDAQQ